MPWIELEGAVNVRDLGGLPTEDGRNTVGARLLRADNLQELSASDIERLVSDFGVTTVVDLRSSTELESEGPAPLDAVAGVADYAATGERIGAILDRLRRSPTYASDINSKPAHSHQARPETMTAFLEQLDSRYGGLAKWLADHGFSDVDLRLLRARLRYP